MTGTVLDIQRYSIHDGPGIRTTVFLKGCPLRCPWCHNPESQSPTPEIVLASGRCVHCGACVEACPQHVAAPGAITAGTDAVRCVRCGACVRACPSEARTRLGRELSAAELVAEIERDGVFYEESGGGVTFSGGEPLMQAEFLLACLALCRSHGCETAIDTCGYAPAEALERAAKLTNLFLYDLKLMDDVRHRAMAGVSNATILSNLRLLVERGAAVWIRYPLIPDVNDDDENLAATADFLRSLSRRLPVHVLPYHRIGLHKYDRLGVRYGLPQLAEPTAERVAQVTARLTELGLDARIGG